MPEDWLIAVTAPLFMVVLELIPNTPIPFGSFRPVAPNTPIDLLVPATPIPLALSPHTPAFPRGATPLGVLPILPINALAEKLVLVFVMENAGVAMFAVPE